MIQLRVGFVIALALMICLILVINPALADLKPYSIDGDLSDWGITMDEIEDGLVDDDVSAWIPDCPTCQDVDWIVENDLYSDYQSECTWNEPTHAWNFCEVGVHETGTYTSNTTYKEPRLMDTRSNPPRQYVPQPSGGEKWDIEALYFDDDEYFVYFGIVTSNITGMGDLYLEVNGNSYGVILQDHGTFKRGEIYKDPTWDTSWWAAKENGDPIITRITSGTKVDGNAIIAINASDNPVPSDNNYPNYIMEIKIDKRLIGSPPINLEGNIGYALTCGNDYIEKRVTYNYETIPEFGAILIPAGVILGFFYYHRSKNKRD